VYTEKENLEKRKIYKKDSITKTNGLRKE